MRVKTLKVGTLEIPLDELDADVLEVGILRIIRGDTTAEFTVTPSSGEIVDRIVYELSSNSSGLSSPEPAGSAVLSVFSDGTGKMTISVSGLKTIETESGFYEGWLIHDIYVPDDLSDDDFVLLNHGPNGECNLRSGIYTLDGSPPYAGNGLDQHSNTLWVPVSMGTFNTDFLGGQKCHWTFSPQTNWTFSLLELLGLSPKPEDNEDDPRDPDSPASRSMRLIPSGISRDILVDTFIRRATVHPELTLDHDFTKRLLTIYFDRIDHLDNDGDGLLDRADVIDKPECFIPYNCYQRVAITREINDGWLGPRYIPSQKAFVLSGMRI